MVKSVVLPAHAQLSGCASSITASSVPDDPPPRFVVIVDADTEEVLCGEENGTAEVFDLPPGEYLVLGDSLEEDSHTITISTECSSETLTYTTDDTDCSILFATVSIPDGAITPGGGVTVSGSWGCTGGNCGSEA